jgi:hypothetical protein
MHRLMLVAMVALVTTACPDREARPNGEPAVQPVDMDTVAWFREGRVVAHGGYRWVITGPPVYEPLALTRVGEFEGTPLYGERSVASPPRRIYIPVGGGYWQMLERGQAEAPADTPPDVDVQPGTEGVEP